MMAPFFRGLVRFFSHKNGNDTSPSGISNDELVTAYEGLTEEGMAQPLAETIRDGEREIAECKCRIREISRIVAILRKLGAA